MIACNNEGCYSYYQSPDMSSRPIMKIDNVELFQDS
jgi:hypothetical protein